MTNVLGGPGLLADAEPLADPELRADVDRAGPGAATSLAALGRVIALIGVRWALSASELGEDADTAGELCFPNAAKPVAGDAGVAPPGELPMAPKPGALWGASPTDALDTEAAAAGFPGDDSREARWVLPGATTELEFVRADIGAGPSRFDALVPVLEAGWPPLFVPIAVRRELLARELEEDVATAGELGCSIRAFVNPAQAAAEAAGVAPRGGLPRAPKPGALWDASPTDGLDTEAATAGFWGDDGPRAGRGPLGVVTEPRLGRAGICAGLSRFGALGPLLVAE